MAIKEGSTRLTYRQPASQPANRRQELRRFAWRRNRRSLTKSNHTDRLREEICTETQLSYSTGTLKTEKDHRITFTVNFEVPTVIIQQLRLRSH